MTSPASTPASTPTSTHVTNMAKLMTRPPSPGVTGHPHDASLREFRAPLRSVSLASRAPDLADRLGLTLDAGEEGPIATPLQSFPDQRAKDDLEAHRQLERGRRPPREDPGPVQDVLGDHEENSRLVREHHASWSGRPRRPPIPSRGPGGRSG